MAFKVAIAPSKVFAFTVDPSNIAAGATSDVTVTVKGLSVNNMVMVVAPSLEPGLVICNAHVPSRNTLKFRLANVTTDAINPDSQTMYALVF